MPAYASRNANWLEAMDPYLRYRDLEDAIKDILLLEQFYRTTENLVRTYSASNNLGRTLAKIFTGNEIESDGFQFSAGRTVWKDIRTGLWYAISP